MLDLVPRSLNECCGFQWVLLFWVVIYFQVYFRTCLRVIPLQNLKIRVKRLFLKKITFSRVNIIFVLPSLRWNWILKVKKTFLPPDGTRRQWCNSQASIDGGNFTCIYPQEALTDVEFDVLGWQSAYLTSVKLGVCSLTSQKLGFGLYICYPSTQRIW